MDEDVDIETMTAQPPRGVDGGLSAAILLMLLEDSDSSAVLQHLEPAEVKLLGKGMFEASGATEADVEQALELFLQNSHDIPTLTVDAPLRIRGMMNLALGDSTASRIWSDIAPAATATTSLESLKWMDTHSIATLVATEHPQFAAIILSALSADVAAEVVRGLDENVQADLLFRAATLGPVSADAFADIEAILSTYSSGGSQNPPVNLGGHIDVAKIVNNLDRPQAEKLLKTIRKKDRHLADQIEDGMFVFADLARLDADSLGAVVGNVGVDRLAIAIGGPDAALGEQILATLSATTAQTITDQIAEMGSVNHTDIDDAKNDIALAARRLAAAGEITLPQKGKDHV